MFLLSSARDGKTDMIEQINQLYLCLLSVFAYALRLKSWLLFALLLSLHEEETSFLFSTKD
jgi:hypothetical protein